VTSIFAGPRPSVHEESARWIATIAANPKGQHHLMPSGRGRLDRLPSRRRRVRDTVPWRLTIAPRGLRSRLLLTPIRVQIESENARNVRRPLEQAPMT
jgi:hypothetical protein